MNANRIDQLIERWSPELRAAFLSAIKDIRDAAQIGVIAERLDKGDIEGAVRAVGIDPVKFRDLDKTITQAFDAGGVWSASRIPAVREPDGLKFRVVFDVRNPRAEAWLAERSSNLVSAIVDDQRMMIREAMRAGMQAGQNPRDVALDLVGRISAVTKRREGGAIGLTASQEQWVRNYRADLQNLASGALQRDLRDKRFDRTVMAAIRNEKPLTAKQIDTMVAAYRNRALRYRAEAIARTESMRALHASQDEAFRQAVESGNYADDQVERTWSTAGDKRVRDTHQAMDGQVITGLDTLFVSPSGATLRYPGDERAPAAETVNCRCWQDMRVNFLKGLR